MNLAIYIVIFVHKLSRAFPLKDLQHHMFPLFLSNPIRFLQTSSFKLLGFAGKFFLQPLLPLKPNTLAAIGCLCLVGFPEYFPSAFSMMHYFCCKAFKFTTLMFLLHLYIIENFLYETILWVLQTLGFNFIHSICH